MINKQLFPLKAINSQVAQYTILILKENDLMRTSRFDTIAHSEILMTTTNTVGGFSGFNAN